MQTLCNFAFELDRKLTAAFEQAWLEVSENHPIGFLRISPTESVVEIRDRFGTIDLEAIAKLIHEFFDEYDLDPGVEFAYVEVDSGIDGVRGGAFAVSKEGIKKWSTNEWIQQRREAYVRRGEE